MPFKQVWYNIWANGECLLYKPNRFASKKRKYFEAVLFYQASKEKNSIIKNDLIGLIP